MGLTRLAIARPVVILMMIAAFLVLGIVAYFRLPAELNPQVDFPRVTVPHDLQRHEPAGDGNACHQAD